MVRPQNNGSLRKGVPSFAIKDILDLPNETDNSTEPSHKPSALVVSPVYTTYQPLKTHAPPSILSCYWHRRPRRMTTFSSRIHTPGLRFLGDFSKESSLDTRGAGHKCGLGLRSFMPPRKKKQRPLFSPLQVEKMEREFEARKYLTEVKRANLAADLGLTETQVKTWYQNRRTKWRKELRGEDPPREVPDGRLKGIWRQSDEARDV